MSSASDHCATVLSAIIPDRRDLLDVAQRHLSPDHFPDATLRNVFIMLERYAEVTGAILTRASLVDQLRHARADAGKVSLYTETYDLLYHTPADEPSFRWSLQQVRDLAAERYTGEALTSAMQILTRGTEDDAGQLLRGHAEARTHILQRFAEIDRDLSMQEAPEGDMRAEGDDILADYAASKAARAAGRSTGIGFGIASLDEKVNLQNGDLCLIVGFTSEGKTSLVCQLAWSASVQQRKNVVILTTETIRSQVRRRIISRHSCHPHFEIPKGLNSRAIREGTLSPEQEAKLGMVVSDFTNNPGYGRCYIVQVPREASVGYLESKLLRIQRMFHIDLVIMDYLALLKSDRRRNSDREELNGILKGCKQLATSFNDGLGVPFVSPWQVSRSARQEAEKTGFYTASALSETAESANSSDVIISLLAPLDNDQREADLRMQAMKQRDGEKANSILVRVDYATSRFTTKDAGSAGMDELLSDDPLGAQ